MTAGKWMVKCLFHCVTELCCKHCLLLFYSLVVILWQPFMQKICANHKTNSSLQVFLEPTVWVPCSHREWLPVMMPTTSSVLAVVWLNLFRFFGQNIIYESPSFLQIIISLLNEQKGEHSLLHPLSLNCFPLVCTDQGLIIVQSAMYGRQNRETCSYGRPVHQLSNINCALTSTLDKVKKRYTQ